MGLIPHIMVVDDDPRVLDSLVPALPLALKRQIAAGIGSAAWLSDLEPGSAGVRVTCHGYPGERARPLGGVSPYQIHLHLVREQGGRFDTARRLLNDQIFGVVVSDLRFADEAPAARAGQYFVEEIRRVHPEVQGLLYSAYPRPEGFPPERFLRKGGEEPGTPTLADAVTTALARFLAEPPVAAFERTVREQGLAYQSEAFGRLLAQVFSLSRLLGPAARSGPGTRRPLPCVLIDGESGTGKRGLSALFHAASERRKGPLVLASCNDLTNETLLRSILFGHRRGAFTDAREDRRGLVATAGAGLLVLDDFHRLPPACSAILHSFLEDGEYSRLGEEEVRQRSEAAVVLTVETEPWAQRRLSGELPLAFLARVERLPVLVPPLRDRPDDIAVQARAIVRGLAAELNAPLELGASAATGLLALPFAESNSRELRNLLEQAALQAYRLTDVLEWSHVEPHVSRARGVAAGSPCPSAATATGSAAARPRPGPQPTEWQRRLQALAARILARSTDTPPDQAEQLVARLFDEAFPAAWEAVEASRRTPGGVTISLPVWEDLWRCFAVYWLGGPTPAEKVLGIPSNTLRQWIGDRESR